MADTRRLPVPCTEQWEWQLRAACRSVENRVFFHPERERGAHRKVREEQAKQICARCPVQPQCRDHALRAEERYGVWGGLGETERRHMIAMQRRARHDEPGRRPVTPRNP